MFSLPTLQMGGANPIHLILSRFVDLKFLSISILNIHFPFEKLNILRTIAFTFIFCLPQRDGNLCGRGASDDKGPVLCWIWFVEFHRKMGIPLPVNLKLIFEGMEESGSEMFEECLGTLKNNFLSNVDGICVSDSTWVGTEKPCVSYGLRGIIYFAIEVLGGVLDLHSGEIYSMVLRFVEISRNYLSKISL
jgi:hypothetical protein